MARVENVEQVISELKQVRQVRQYTPEPVSQDILDQLLEIARWSGSARNTQPWRFIVINDKEKLRQVSQVRPTINWVAGAPLAIAITLNGSDVMMENYDAGRVSERLLIGARLLGLGGGTAWFGDEAQENAAKKILGIPAGIHTHFVIALGYAVTSKDPRPNPAKGGRKPLSEIIRYNQYD